MAPKKDASILIVSDKDEFSRAVSTLLRQHLPESELTEARTAMEARNFIREQAVDVVIINCPLGGSLGDDLAHTLVKLSYASIVIICPEQIVERLNRKVESEGVFVLEKPLKKNAFLEEIELALLVSQRTRILYEENVTLKRKIKELKKVDQAKVLLVEYLKFSEAQAHHYIETQAMELRKTKGEVAQSIINTYQS